MRWPPSFFVTARCFSTALCENGGMEWHLSFLRKIRAKNTKNLLLVTYTTENCTKKG